MVTYNAIANVNSSVPSLGLPIDFDITGGEVHECKIACDFVQQLPVAVYTIADRSSNKEESYGR